MEFTKSNLPGFRADIATALASVEAKHGVKFDLGRISYTATNFRVKLECNSASDQSGNAVDPRLTKFLANTFRYNISDAAFGQTFTSRGRKFKIVGLNPRAKKYPLSVEDTKGGRYKMPMSALPNNLKAR